MTDDDDLDENLEIGTSLPALRLREAAEWIARAEPELSTDTVHRNLFASIWRGEFDSGGLILLEDGGKQRHYDRYLLGRVIYLMRPHHDNLDFQYRPASLREPGPLWEGRLPDIDSDQADWEKIAAWPLEAYNYLSPRTKKIYVDCLALTEGAIEEWCRKRSHLLLRLSAEQAAPIPRAGGRRPNDLWYTIAVEAGAWMADEGAPSDLAELEAFLTMRCIVHEYEADPRTVKKWAERYHTAYTAYR